MAEEGDLLIPIRALELLEKEAVDVYPEECCGILVGRREDRRAIVHEVVVAQNSASDRRHESYSIDPELLLRVQTESRERRLEVLGYYHSHPDHSAIPGRADLEAAWPGACYLILSVDRERVAEVRCWRLRNEGAAFEEMDIGYS